MSVFEVSDFEVVDKSGYGVTVSVFGQGSAAQFFMEWPVADQFASELGVLLSDGVSRTHREEA